MKTSLNPGKFLTPPKRNIKIPLSPGKTVFRFLLMGFLFCLGGCASSQPDPAFLKELLYQESLRANKSLCSQILARRLTEASTIEILARECHGNVCDLKLKVISPEIDQKGLRALMGQALLQALKEGGAPKRVSQRICQYLAQKIDEIPLTGKRLYYLRLKIKKEDHHWHIVKRSPKH